MNLPDLHFFFFLYSLPLPENALGSVDTTIFQNISKSLPDGHPRLELLTTLSDNHMRKNAWCVYVVPG